ncbi:MAG: glycosyltransferase [Desulfatitalea sp.]|nr:glycosyltransferase [Desulfatitalea sp.]NNK00800.1 glycosyltransferase [Desulfatitalea sp.]
MTTHCIIMPLYNDWSSAGILIRKIDQQVASWQGNISVVLVNDGSQEQMPSTHEWIGDCDFIEHICVIDLVCNMGHQRAIAVGLAYAHNLGGFDSVFIMDSDGEDPPHELNDLHRSGRDNPGAIITADRASRSEGPLFRFWYWCYKLLFFLLTGTQIRFGNFSHIPAHQLDRLVHYPDLWNSLSGTLKRSGLPIKGIPSHRGMRYVGPSKMNFNGLVIHGMSAIAVLKEAVMVRLMIMAALVWIGAALLWAIVAVAGYGPWRSWLALLALFGLQTHVVLAMILFTHLNRRAHALQGPAMFWQQYVRAIHSLK